MSGKKDFNFSLELMNRKEGEKRLKNQIKKELTVVFENRDEGIKVTWKKLQSEHPLKSWTEDMFKESGMRLLLEVPEIKQKKTNESFNKKEKEIELVKE